MQRYLNQERKLNERFKLNCTTEHVTYTLHPPKVKRSILAVRLTRVKMAGDARLPTTTGNIAAIAPKASQATPAKRV